MELQQSHFANSNLRQVSKQNCCLPDWKFIDNLCNKIIPSTLNIYSHDSLLRIYTGLRYLRILAKTPPLLELRRQFIPLSICSKEFSYTNFPFREDKKWKSWSSSSKTNEFACRRKTLPTLAMPKKRYSNKAEEGKIKINLLS